MSSFGAVQKHSCFCSYCGGVNVHWKKKVLRGLTSKLTDYVHQR